MAVIDLGTQQGNTARAVNHLVLIFSFSFSSDLKYPAFGLLHASYAHYGFSVNLFRILLFREKPGANVGFFSFHLGGYHVKNGFPAASVGHFGRHLS